MSSKKPTVTVEAGDSFDTLHFFPPANGLLVCWKSCCSGKSWVYKVEGGKAKIRIQWRGERFKADDWMMTIYEGYRQSPNMCVYYKPIDLTTDTVATGKSCNFWRPTSETATASDDVLSLQRRLNGMELSQSHELLGYDTRPYTLVFKARQVDLQDIGIKIEAGAEYEVEVTSASRSDDEMQIQHRYIGKTTFRAEHTRQDLDTLMSKAQIIRDYSRTAANFQRCVWLYRHKPPEYFDEISKKHGNIMKVYIKDENGDPASCINGNLKGLFFSANVKFGTFGEPMDFPIFGKKRLQIPCQKLIQAHYKLYFADMYCTTSSMHTVTLVVTKPSTQADRFCEQKLKEINKTNSKENPFLFFQDGEFYVSTRILVEVLYTEDINIARSLSDGEAEFHDCLMPAVTTRHGGVIKRHNCPRCNV